MFYTKSLHPKCPTTLLWVETLFYLCCVGTGTGQLPPVHTNYSDTSEAWIGNSVSYLNWTQILHKYLHTFSNITQIFTHFLQVLMVYKKVYNVSRKYQENWNKEHPINNQQKSHPFNVSDKYHVCLGSSTEDYYQISNNKVYQNHFLILFWILFVCSVHLVIQK